MKDKIPDIDIFISNLKKMEELSNSLFLAIRKKKCEYPYFAAHLQLAIKDATNKAYAISRLNGYYLNEIYILYRNLIEVVIDMFWIFSFKDIDDNSVEILSKRFFMFSSFVFLKYGESTEWNIDNNKFLNDNKEKFGLESQIEAAKKYLNITEMEDTKANNKLRKKQRQEWRLLPNYHKDSNEIIFKNRADSAEPLFRKICVCQEYSFSIDYQVLSKYVHPYSLRFDLTMDSYASDSIYLQMLNRSICCSMYLVTLYLELHAMDKPTPYKEIECVLLWL